MEKITVFIADAAGLPDPLSDRKALRGLPPYRQEKIRRLVSPKARIVSFGAGLLLQYVLEENGISPAEIRVSKTGKPMVSGLYFNISHSKTKIICAAGKSAVGCDIEKIKKAPTGIGERYFSLAEIEYFRAAEDKDRAFFTLWTRKESYIKMTGEGLACPLDSFSALPDAPVIRDGSPAPAYIRTLWIDGFLVSVCTAEAREPDMYLVDLQKTFFDIKV